MRNILDNVIVVCFGVLLTSVATYAVFNTLTRADTITIPLELPNRLKPVVLVYDFMPEEKVPVINDTVWYTWYHDDESTPVSFVDHTRDDLFCLATNIYFEARNESTKGQLAVGLVTLNRVASPFYPDNICDVVYQEDQFSWFWDGLPDRPRNPRAFQQSLLIASALLNGTIVDFTDGADHYHADYVAPGWAGTMVKVTQIETHIFYRDEARHETL